MCPAMMAGALQCMGVGGGGRAGAGWAERVLRVAPTASQRHQGDRAGLLVCLDWVHLPQLHGRRLQITHTVPAS